MSPRAHALFWLVLAASAARADSVGGMIEEDFSRSTATTSGPSAAEQRVDTSLFTQRYRLFGEKSLDTNLRVQAGGSLEQYLGDTRTQGILASDDARATNFFANLVLASPLLSGAAGYTRRQIGTPGVPSLITQEPSLSLLWRPLDLPVLSLRLSRPSTWDSSRQFEDVDSDVATLTAQYAPVEHLDLKYTFDYQQPRDHLHRNQSTVYTQTGAISAAETFVPWSTSAAATLSGTFRRAEVTASGTGGTSSVQLFPIAGFSVVETFPAIPSLVTLAPNPALIDGNFTAGSGLDLGYSVTVSGDTNLRDVGVQFADVITRVNTMYVWVDRTLPPTVAATFTWDVWRSDDNLHWNEVGIVGLPVFAPFENRFEITFPIISARYLKVVTRPLSPAATTDQRLADILVTAAQVFLVEAVTTSSGWQKTNSQLLTTALRTQIFGRQDLAYDVSLQASRSEQADRSQSTYILANGLTYNERLSRVFVVSARLARQDFDQTHGHEFAYLYSGSVSATELPELAHTLTASGQATTNADGTTVANSVTFLNRATLYEGVGLVASFAWSGGTTPAHQSSRNDLLTFGATLQPHPALKVGLTWSRTDTEISGGDLPVLRQHAQRYDGTVAFNPFPALTISAGFTRNVGDPRSYSLANAVLGFSPLQGGELQFALNVSETADTSGAVSGFVTPTLIWTINRRAVLTVSYALVDTDTAVLATHTRTVDFNLRIPL